MPEQNSTTKVTAQEKKGFDQNIFETLGFAYRPYFVRIALFGLMGLLGRGLLLGNANAIGAWVDGRIHLGLPSFLLVLAAMATLGFAMTLTFRVAFSRYSAQAISQIYDEVTLRTSRYPMSFFDQTPAGRIITRFSSDYGNVFRLFSGTLAEFMSILFDLTMMLILIGVASPWFLIFVGLMAFCNYLVYRGNRSQLRQLRRELSSSRSPSIAHFAETSQGASMIRAFRRESAFTSRFEKMDQFFLGKKLATIRGLVFFSLQMNSLSAFFLLSTGLASIYLVQRNLLTIGAVGVAFTFIAMSGNTIQMFFEWLSQLEEALIGVERLDRYLRKPIEEGNQIPAQSKFMTGHRTYESDLEQGVQQRTPFARAAAVSVQNLWFRYGEKLPWVLKGISFEIQPGERLGIIGRTGSGKSSLIQALFRMYPIDQGKIEINQVSADVHHSGQGIDLNRYRQSIAFISQEPILFQGTLRMNLDIERIHTDEQIYAALDRVDLGSWARSLKLGLEDPIEERGKNLSMGERQLLCMARCLLQEAPVIIMDEATSAIDPQSEEILVKATDQFFAGRTQILIAHRLSTLKSCDRVLWLENGEIRQIGPTLEVLKAFETAAILEAP